MEEDTHDRVAMAVNTAENNKDQLKNKGRVNEEPVEELTNEGGFEDELPEALVNEGIQEELENMVKMKVYAVVDLQDLPANARLIPTRWVHRRKGPERVRSRLVLKDFRDGTYNSDLYAARLHSRASGACSRWRRPWPTRVTSR